MGNFRGFRLHHHPDQGLGAGGAPSSCWKSSRLSAQLYFWAMDAVWKMAFSSFWREAAVFMMRMVTRNILSLRV